MRILFSLLLIFQINLTAYSLVDSTSTTQKIQINGFLDTYYQVGSLDFSPSFLYNFTVKNSPAINLGYLKLSNSNSNFRWNVALHQGTYVNKNYMQEPEGLRWINEANCGFSINSKQYIWFDLGIFPSFIGFESAISKDNLTLTRSIIAENSPYFMSGFRFQMVGVRWQFSGFLLTGWQRIIPQKNNSFPAIGTQLVFQKDSKNSFNWSTYAGNEVVDNLNMARLFNNFYWQSKWSNRMQTVIGFDVGVQQKTFNANWSSWLGASVISQVKLNNQLKLAGRLEFYSDPEKVIIQNANGGKLFGTSLNLDYNPLKSILIRIEYKRLGSNYQVFDNLNQIGFLTSSCGISF